MIKFYLDKADKNGLSAIHLVLRKKDFHVKVSTGEKIREEFWDAAIQLAKPECPDYEPINKYLSFLRKELEKYIDSSPFSQLTDKKVKEKALSLINGRKSNSDSKMVKEDNSYCEGKESFTFIDLFAGAGGFSEGFLQAESDNRIFDFLLASDINENCELTHLARYNHQLGLDLQFIKQDITEPDFLDNLMKALDGKQVDVVCGGPPCQSFSLAGKRKKFDKKDDLFAHYLKVIRSLRPKYFVMENVKGILTKEGGKIREMILQEIRSIIDPQEFHQLVDFLERVKKESGMSQFLLDCYELRFQFETADEKETERLKENFIKNVDVKFRLLTPKIVDYKTSKTDVNVNTIRHGFDLLKQVHKLDYIRKKVINEKAACNVDNDLFAEDFDNFLTAIAPETIVGKMETAIKSLKKGHSHMQEVEEMLSALEIYISGFDECMESLKRDLKKSKKNKELDDIISQIRLYNIDEPFVALASDYGVPQNRERVLFIGSRKDQKIIKNVPSTVSDSEKVTVFEALHDLDFLGNAEERFDYEETKPVSKKLASLVKKRDMGGKEGKGATFAEWSRKGRLSNRFPKSKKPFYVRNFDELKNDSLHLVAPLHNHKTSKQSEDVIERLQIILNTGDYFAAKKVLEEKGLDSDKRNYNVLRADSQSPTVLTIPDDYIHYSSPRALTVREMARLQSFDDSFVFQGKRSTGGEKRKTEVPQFTLVGNAVPPLMARAIGMEVLKNIR